MRPPLRVLVVDDSVDDTDLAVRELQRRGWDTSHERVDEYDDLVAAVERREWDMVLCDYSLPRLDALRCLDAVAAIDPHLPCVVVSGRAGEEVAVEVMKRGAYDFVLKDRMARLGGVVERTLREAAERRRIAETEQALHDLEQRFRSVVDHAVDAIITIDERGLIETFNPAAERMFGYRADETVGRAVSILMADPPRGECPPALGGRRSGEAQVISQPAEFVARDKHGTTFPVELTVSEAWIGGRRVFTQMVRDIRERKAFETMLARQALHDPLTGLANRTLLVERVDHALARASRRPGEAALLFLDLDHFKVINDSLGHAAGDQLLCLVAEQLTSLVRPADTVARFGGDEFVILCEQVPDERGPVAIAERIAARLRAPFRVAGTEVVVSASVGVAFVDETTFDGDSLLRDADSAMYRAKARGRDRFEIFDQELRARVIDRLEIEQGLRRAIEHDELRLHFQPELSLLDGRVVGVEALLRWEHPSRGLLRPAQFLDVAEETGLIVPIGSWVIAEAHRQATRWADATGSPPTVWVNLSARQLTADPMLVETVARTLREGDPRVTLGVEITEDALISDPATATATTIALRALGVRVSIDDFGTGYSSLSYLKQFPAQALKVDCSFVSGLGADAKDTAIITAVLGLGRALGLDVVAEGVETAEQAAILRCLGCSIAQGYHFARPLPGAEVGPFMATRTAAARP
jgi:diguanylate cyclase (GGDEF)-like protein/PAS domain S-box-containing protein